MSDEEPLGHLPNLLRQLDPGAHDNLTVLTQVRPSRRFEAHPISASAWVPDSVLNTAQHFLQSQADLQAHLSTLRADLSSEQVEAFEGELTELLEKHEEAAQALLAGYQAVLQQNEATFTSPHQAAQFATHTLQHAGEKPPHAASVFDLRASEATQQLKKDFEASWRQYQREHLDDAPTLLMWNLMAGYVGQLSGTGLGGHLGRALTLGAAAGGLAGVPAAALGALVGLLVTPVAHTLLSDPLQAMLRDVTVTSPGAELQLEMFKLKARLITDSYREHNGRAVRADFKWLDERTGVVHLVTAKDYAERMRDQLPDAFQAFTGKFLEEDMPYLFGDGLVGTLRPMLRGTDPGWWTQTTQGKLTEWLGLQMFVLGPLCGAINHAVGQHVRAWNVGEIPALERRLALAESEGDRKRLLSELALAREELKRCRYHLKSSRPHESELRSDLQRRIRALEGQGAREEVNKPIHLWQRECVWLASYAQDLGNAIDDLRSWREPLFANVAQTQDARERELADLQRELRAVQRQLAEAEAKSSIAGNYQYRLNTLLQPQHRLNPSEPETPGKRWETLSTVLGKATGMLPYTAVQVVAANIQSLGGAQLSTTLLSAALPPLYFIGGGGFVGWMSRTEWTGIWRQAIAHARGVSMSRDNEARRDVVLSQRIPEPSTARSGWLSRSETTSDREQVGGDDDAVTVDLTPWLGTQDRAEPPE